MTFKEFVKCSIVGFEIHVEHLLELCDVNLYSDSDEVEDFYNRANSWDNAALNYNDRLFLEKEDMRINVTKELIKFMEAYGYSVDFEVLPEKSTHNTIIEKQSEVVVKPIKSLF